MKTVWENVKRDTTTWQPTKNDVFSTHDAKATHVDVLPSGTLALRDGHRFEVTQLFVAVCNGYSLSIRQKP